ncbi:hypothetical protein BOTBODRAFT_39184 [Botryobasidium botryosum FD-172 SS1]|uniref:Uncharacterized protein n=1 Tax=Botryobasidium botryosum (strain FD-172 SS1) TaxID=930990 RepID=A0A067M5U5_BOTB1|nr:hypothetical protein BOTBODRAFT_39184 [Botryobasidium botryosum FD-172 SS1]
MYLHPLIFDIANTTTHPRATLIHHGSFCHRLEHHSQPWRAREPRPGSKAMRSKLHHVGHTVVIAAAPAPHLRPVRTQNLTNHKSQAIRNVLPHLHTRPMPLSHGGR